MGIQLAVGAASGAQDAGGEGGRCLGTDSGTVGTESAEVCWGRKGDNRSKWETPLRAKQFTVKAVKQRSSGSSTRPQLGKVWRNTAELVLLWAEGGLLWVNHPIHLLQHSPTGTDFCSQLLYLHCAKLPGWCRETRAALRAVLPFRGGLFLPFTTSAPTRAERSTSLAKGAATSHPPPRKQRSAACGRSAFRSPGRGGPSTRGRATPRLCARGGQVFLGEKPREVSAESRLRKCHYRGRCTASPAQLRLSPPRRAPPGSSTPRSRGGTAEPPSATAGTAALPRRISQPSADTFSSGAPDKFEQKAPHRSGSSIGPASPLIAIRQLAGIPGTRTKML